MQGEVSRYGHVSSSHAAVPQMGCITTRRIAPHQVASASPTFTISAEVWTGRGPIPLPSPHRPPSPSPPPPPPPAPPA